MVATMSVLILVNFGFVIWFGGTDIALVIIKYYRIVRRYFDPYFMPAPLEDLTGNLPEVYKPFNALEVEADLENNLDSINEEGSQDVQSEFSFRPRPNPNEAAILKQQKMLDKRIADELQ